MIWSLKAAVLLIGFAYFVAVAGIGFFLEWRRPQSDSREAAILVAIRIGFVVTMALFFLSVWREGI